MVCRDSNENPGRRWQVFLYSHCSIDLCKSTICSEQYCILSKNNFYKSDFLYSKIPVSLVLLHNPVFAEHTVFSFLQVQIYRERCKLIIALRVILSPLASPPSSGLIKPKIPRRKEAKEKPVEQVSTSNVTFNHPQHFYQFILSLSQPVTRSSSADHTTWRRGEGNLLKIQQADWSMEIFQSN